MRKISLSAIFITLFTSNIFTQQTTIQFPRLDFHMEMNQQMKPNISYNAQADIVVGDQSGLIFGIGVAGDDLNLQSGLNDLIKLDTLKLSIAPHRGFAFHTFYGRYKYLGEDKVIPRGFQFHYTPGFDYYGYKKIEGAGIATTFPIQEGRYEPELILYSDSYNGIDYFNFDAMTTFRFERWYMELYVGVAAPTIGSIDKKITMRGGVSVYSTIDYINIYATIYVPAHYGKEFTFDDIYMRFSQYLLIDNFEQTFSLTSLGSESDTISDPLIGYNNIPDINIFLSLGGRYNNIGFGAEYGFIYGLYTSDFLVDKFDHQSHRLGGYLDFTFFSLTYKIGAFYTLPNSPAYSQANSKPGEAGFYISVFGAT